MWASITFSHIDHVPTFAKLKYTVKENKAYTKTMWDYRNMDIDSFINIFESKEWNELLSMEIDEAVKALTEFILDAASRCIPRRTFSVYDKDKPWVNRVLKDAIKRRNKLFKTAKSSNNDRDWVNWKVQRNMVTAINRKLKGRHINTQAKKLVESRLNPKNIIR